MKYSNNLIRETSPYLLQHAHNPVNWHAWNDETLEKARKANKMILVSIGYSACHWCHVMEHESFEDEEVAKLMNEYFICIKVDREERPDIDQVYMTAVQLMTGHGGWPLNCFALPDGRPIYGGTYYPKQQWINVLMNLADLYNKDKEKVEGYAQELTNGIIKTELINQNLKPREFNMEFLDASVKIWSKRLDNVNGGPDKAPKFPLPNNYVFLLRYAHFTNNVSIQKHVDLTLKKMAYGGIFDQLGGGFARYSVDGIWKVPHFEKMLYDNAQLISLYAEAYQAAPNELYKEVVYKTIDFVERELTSADGSFYSALDADSEGEEGKFYIWQQEELKKILEDDFALFADYYNVNDKGYWEHHNYILLREEGDQEIALKYHIPVGQLKEKIASATSRLMKVREKRVRPGLDDKCLTSWNGLMLKAYCDAYKVFGEDRFLQVAIRNAMFIRQKQLRDEGGLFHSYKNGKSTINGFLEDYAFTADAFLALYQCTGHEDWLGFARQLCDYAIEHFLDKKSGMFYFTSDEDTALIARKTELSDNVIPASTSQMARNLWYLAKLYLHEPYEETALRMLHNISDELVNYGPGYSNWGILMLDVIHPFHEVAIVGKNVDEMFLAFRKHYHPNSIFALGKQPSELPLLKNRFVEGKSLIYVCKDHTCGLPAESTEEALKQMN
ncbi:MAG: thioredoxin domain-containing protein [Bacteroidia bacterium]